MAVPKRKTSKSKRNMRRSHDGLKPVGLVECSSCGDFKRAHHVCPHCGHYKDRQTIKV
ncbi:MAG: 50S ribosomal protein L32 [Alphaproteobacteria bacterium]